MATNTISITGFNNGSKEFKRGYANGVTDALREILKMQNPDIDAGSLENVLERCKKDLQVGKKDLLAVLGENGFVPRKNSLISAGDIAKYPSAVSGIAAFLDRVFEGSDESYLIFAGAFEHMVDLFHDEVKTHIKGGGYKVAAVIIITYITMRVMYKAGMIIEPLTIKASATLFDKAPGSIKRILTRIRDNNDRIMKCIEGKTALPQDLGEIVEMFKNISSETSL